MEGMGLSFDDYGDDVGDDFRVKGRRERFVYNLVLNVWSVL